MAVKNYGIRDQWTNLDKLNNVDIKSVDGVIESVKINGEEAGGGGGSSDFSTAEVTIIWDNPQIEVNWDSCPIIENGMINGATYADTSPAIVTVPLYKGKCLWVKSTRGLTLSGNIEQNYEGVGMFITGNGTITMS